MCGYRVIVVVLRVGIVGNWSVVRIVSHVGLRALGVYWFLEWV